jgi:hypothetical protein
MILKVALIPLIAVLCLFDQRNCPAYVVRSNVPTFATAFSASKYASLIFLESKARCSFVSFSFTIHPPYFLLSTSKEPLPI